MLEPFEASSRAPGCLKAALGGLCGILEDTGGHWEGFGWFL